ncbi:MAG: hypothetical protein WCR79_01690 [Fusobacterium sp.]
MDANMMMMAGRVITDTVGGYFQHKYAKKAAASQRKQAEIIYKFNKSQVESSYRKSFSNGMADYADSRLELAGQALDAQSKINVFASQQGTNLAYSSAVDDMQNTLDNEFSNGMQNLLTNNIRQLSTLASNMTIQQMQLDRTYDNQLGTIDNTLNKVNQSINQRITGDVMQLASKGFEEYQASTARNKILSGESPQDNKLNELLNFSFTGGNK